MERSMMLLVASLATALAGEVAFSEPATFSCAEMETFLSKAHPGPMKQLGVGVTNSHRMTLDDGNMRHDAHLQTIDEKKVRFEGTNGVEINFRDYYKYNIAAYRLAKMLALNMVPPYIERRIGSETGSVSWWVNGATMESQRYKQNVKIPDPDRWNEQMYAVRVFHELVYDTDPNLTNLLITPDWQLWIIDLTRAFRTNTNLRDSKNLVKCDRRLLASMRALDADTMKQNLGEFLNKSELHGLDARRAKIVKFFDTEIKAKGESAVLYDFPRTAQACGTGL
ncbi:MAG: hypothetical protein M3Z32_04200 [Acidobacteriota bacterium]|nr:hypothetical protein [Acidobacteriota bacterium]